jgi:hypothetical protein
LPDLDFESTYLSGQMTAEKDSVQRRVDTIIDHPVRKASTSGNFQDTAVFTLSKDSIFFNSPDTSAAPQLLLQPLLKKVETTNLFGQHELQPVHRGPISRPDLSPGWLFPVILIIAAVFTWLRLFYARYFNQMVAALFNTNLTGQIVRDENILLQRATVYLSLLFYLIASLFLYELSFRMHWDLSLAGNGLRSQIPGLEILRMAL